MENKEQENLSESVRRAIESVPPERAEELKFEVDLFLAKLQLVAEKSAGTSSLDKKIVRENLYEFLRDDLVYFLQKLLSEHRHTFEKMMPGMVASHREVIFQLKELEVRAFYPVGKDFSKTSMVGRWFLTLHAHGLLTPQKVMGYFNIYKNRLYSLIDDRPFGFSDTESLVRQMLFSQDYEVSFDEIYSGELELRKEITFTLLRRLSTHNRLEYLVSKEIIEELSDNFIRVLHRETANRLRQALADMDELNKRILAEKKNVDSEIRIAAKTQDRSIQKLPQGDDRIRFGLWYEPLMSVGGDYYNVRQIDDHEYSIFLGDISGHGLGAAMFVNTLRLAYEEHSDHPDRPEKTMRHLNQALYGKLAENFVTAIYIYINLKKRIIKYCNAGHPKAFLIQKSNDRVQVRFLRRTGKILGLFNHVHFREVTVPIADAARLIVYTDGITEAEGTQGQMLGERGFLSMFRGNLTSTTDEAMEAIKKSVIDFQGSAPPEDDRSIIIADLFGGH